MPGVIAGCGVVVSIARYFLTGLGFGLRASTVGKDYLPLLWVDAALVLWKAACSAHSFDEF